MTTENATRNKARTRKLLYIILICVLIVPLFKLSQPSTQGGPNVKGQRGGFLAQYRDANHLSQSDLGQIDPTSETLRLGTLGMRGPAGALLWLQAQEQQKKKDWTQLRSTLDQISKLQPHSINVWKFQAWNLSYNVSVAFDDYRDKFYWVIEGVKFMLKGVTLNPQEPRLAWDMGWFVAHKIGRADDAKQFRRLFQENDAFQEIVLPPGELPGDGVDLKDNWQVGKLWFLAAEDRIDDRHPVRGMAEAIFYSNPPMCQFYYADNLEKDGHFGDPARYAWAGATREWDKYGEREIPQTDCKPIQMNRREYYEDEVKKVTKEIDAMEPGLREKIIKEKRAALTAEQRSALDTPAEKQTPTQATVVAGLSEQLAVTNEAVARRLKLPEDQKKQVIKRARYGKDCEDFARYIDRERKMVNFDFWRLRAIAEQTDDMLEARQHSYRADLTYHNGDLNGANGLYKHSLKSWRKVLDDFPALVEDVSLGGDLVDMIHRYMRCLHQLGEDHLPKPFILQDILDRHDRDQKK